VMGTGALTGRVGSSTTTSTPGIVGFSSANPKYETFGNSQPAPKKGGAQPTPASAPAVIGDLPQGVNYNSSTGLYEAHIRATSGRFIDLGQYKTAGEAHQKYLEAIPIHHPGKATLGGGTGAQVAGNPSAAETADAPSSSSPRPQTFTVLVDFERMGWRPLGLRLTGLIDNTAIVVVEVMPGPIMEWNHANPNLAVRPRDRIIEVNGVSGESNALVQALKNKQRLAMVVHPPQEFCVTLKKYGETKVGLEVDRSDGLTLQVRSVKPGGLVERWNQANPSQAITAYHAVLEVNGVRGDTETMLHAIFFEDEVDMILQ